MWFVVMGCVIGCVNLVEVVCCRCTRDEWLTTLCGLTLGLVLQGAGCGLICIGAGEEQARKVLALQGLQE